MPPGTLESSVLDGDLRIGDFVVRPLLKVVRPAASDLASGEATLPDKAMAVLVYLAQHARQVCDRDDILDAVWGPEREAYDRVLDNAIREIRRALGDDARNPTYVQTIPKKGYRLLVSVESRLLEEQRDSSGEFVPVVRGSDQVFQRVRRSPSPPAEASPADRTTDEPDASFPRGWHKVGLGVAAVVLLAASAAWWSGVLDSDLVTIAIDVEALDSDPAAGDAAATSPRNLAEAMAKTVFEEHACGGTSVFRRDSWLRAADFRVRLRRQQSGALPLLTAEVEPTGRRVIIHPGADPKATPGALARQVTELLDQAACEIESLPAESRACHCLEGSRRWASLPDSQASVAHLELAITLDPDLIPAYAALADAFHAGGEFEEAMSVLKTGLAKIGDPDSTEALQLRLQLARLLEDPAEVERLVERLRIRHPEDARFRLAQAYLLSTSRSRCEEALELLKPLMAESDRPAAVTIEAARALWLCGQSERMIEVLVEQVESLPRQGELRRWLATSLTLVGRYEEATNYATEAMALEPDRSESYWVLGLVADRQGHYSTAEAWYEKAMELARWPTQKTRVEVGLARVARLRGEYSECVELVPPQERPIAQAYEPPSLLKGLCLVESGQVAEARDALQEFASSLTGPTNWTDNGLALLLQAKIEMAEASDAGQRRQAATHFIEAAEAQAVRVDMVRSEAASALAEAGDFGAAEDWFRKALDVNPNHPWSLCRLGMLLQARGVPDEAADSMRRGLEVFGPRLEDPLAVTCAEALRELDPTWAESTGTRIASLP